MPTQEELNAAQVELDIANDNYAKMANRYNKYQELFKQYALADPKVQERAYQAMENALKDFDQLKLDMYAAEDRINAAQNRMNNYNSIVAQQPTTTQSTNVGTRRKITTTPNWTVTQPEPKPLNNWNILEWLDDNRTQPTLGQNANGFTLRRAAAPEFSLPYQNNTLRWIAWNFAAQSKHDWQQAWQEWDNIVWPKIRNTFYDNPKRVVNKAGDFLLWAPQRKL